MEVILLQKVANLGNIGDLVQQTMLLPASTLQYCFAGVFRF